MAKEKNGRQSAKELELYGDEWDRIGLKELLAGEHDGLYKGKSKFQDIQVIRAEDIRLYLNEQLQFSSLDERIYHEAFVHVPFALGRPIRSVLVLGGGDGLALREILKYESVEEVDLVDIDGKVVSLAKKVPVLVKLNERSFFDKRVRTHIEDAKQFIERNEKVYDLMIIDFPDPTNELLASLYTRELFRQLHASLSDHGLIVCQSNALDATPTVFWSIGMTLAHAGFHTQAYHTIIPSFGDWGFQMAAKTSISLKFNPVAVPHRTLPKQLSTLFSFAPYYEEYKKGATVNSASNLILHHIFKQENI
ncbi:spermidine synthase [Rossellomorea aquimaris]|uniref:spermine/spermidine synthase domain-containing protein n=1 Tax=Rossellomorea aquimaris TaxID=189382 RepID=UPI001CD78E14|nr:spermidine synthase [Rossellomorea aquimaris]MCA1056123.1 spermidine synthase [Rossellomorea aquimaris]